MIRRLRARHRLMSVGLALFAPSILIAALVVRPDPPPTSEGSHIQLPDSPPRTLQVDDVRLSYWVDEAWIVTRGDSGPALFISADASLEHPDVLIYASATATERGAVLPTDAVYLGPLNGTRPAMTPLESAELAGAAHWLLYSLPHQEVLGSAPL